MPRISNALLRKAHRIDPFLPALLGSCRDIRTAQNELRWIREHVEKVAVARQVDNHRALRGPLLQRLIQERASGKPLQYILGTEYFGDLEIACRPGVLIPRQDTAASVKQLTFMLNEAASLPRELRLLDLCTGTGCIPLLFHHELLSGRSETRLQMVGVDISNKALDLARHNIEFVRQTTKHMRSVDLDLVKANILWDSVAATSNNALALLPALERRGHSLFWDIIISNPPYISPSHYWTTTTRSVRGYEPKLALVPPSNIHCNDTQQGDMFYPRLLKSAAEVDAKIVLLEVADIEQACRVAQAACRLEMFDGVEIWNEDPIPRPDRTVRYHQGIPILGEGNARSVLCYRGRGGSWLGKSR